MSTTMTLEEAMERVRVDLAVPVSLMGGETYVINTAAVRLILAEVERLQTLQHELASDVAVQVGKTVAAEAEVERLKGEREDALRAYNSLDAIVEHLGIADSDDTPVDAVQRIERQRDDAEARAKQMEEALLVPEVWSNEERDGMSEAFKRASAKHGHYETLFAVGAWLLRHRAALTEGKKT